MRWFWVATGVPKFEFERVVFPEVDCGNSVLKSMEIKLEKAASQKIYGSRPQPHSETNYLCHCMRKLDHMNSHET